METKASNVDLPKITLQRVDTFRTVYALCDIDPKTKRLKASHYAVCLLYGRSPTWGVFNAQTGNMAWLFESRYGIERAYPKKAWRVKQGSMALRSIGDTWDHEERVKHLRKQTRRR